MRILAPFLVCGTKSSSRLGIRTAQEGLPVLEATCHGVLRGPQIQKPPCSSPLTSPSTFHGLLSRCGFHPCQTHWPGSFLDWGPGSISQGVGCPWEVLPPASLPRQTIPRQDRGGREAPAGQTFWGNPQTR